MAENLGAKKPSAKSTKHKPSWWSQPWTGGSSEDPDFGWTEIENDDSAWHVTSDSFVISDEAILGLLEQQFSQVRSKERVRELAEVFTHQREVDAMLDFVEDAFNAIDIKFLEPTCGSGNFLVEILLRKLRLVTKSNCVNQEQYEHQLLRVVASIYGVDISLENVTEARARIAHVLLNHYQKDANTVEPSADFLNAAALIIGANIQLGDSLNKAESIEFCDWQPVSGARFKRIWSFALVPESEQDLFWAERIEDVEPVHFRNLTTVIHATKTMRGKTETP